MRLVAAVLVIPGDPPPTLNEQKRMSLAKRSYVRTTLRSAAWVAWNQAGRPVFEKADVTVRLYYRHHRRRDLYNVSGGVRPLIDGLEGHMFRDEPVTLHVEILVDRKNPRVEIEVVERPAIEREVDEHGVPPEGSAESQNGHLLGTRLP